MSDMSSYHPDIAALIEGLDRERRATVAVVETLDPDLVVNDEGWSVRDVLYHITLWEQGLLEAAKAALRDERYMLPGREEAGSTDTFNEQHRIESRHLPLELIWADWGAARHSWVQFLKHLDPAELDRLAYVPSPNPTPRSIRWLAQRAIDHEVEHREILETHLTP